MGKTTCIAAGLSVLLGAVTPALADGYLGYTGHNGYSGPVIYNGRYVMKPGCCANAPRPTEQLDVRTYNYPDGRRVIVYPYKNGTGYQPFWWENQGK